MVSNFDVTFEKNKAEFQKKFGVDWINNKQLYLTYIQSLYLSTLTEIANNELGQISAMQKETNQLLQHISQNLSK